jgi:hypothetical protein
LIRARRSPRGGSGSGSGVAGRRSPRTRTSTPNVGLLRPLAAKSARKASNMEANPSHFTRAPGQAPVASASDAAERTRTSKGFPPHGPEPCVSTNFTTAAGAPNSTSAGSERSGASLRRATRQASACAGWLLCSQSTPPLSSRGLGRRPLTAETRVRIPVAVLQNPCVFGGCVVPGVLRHSVRHSRDRLRRV